jgi:hypothetical protein
MVAVLFVGLLWTGSLAYLPTSLRKEAALFERSEEDLVFVHQQSAWNGIKL